MYLPQNAFSAAQLKCVQIQIPQQDQDDEAGREAACLGGNHLPWFEMAASATGASP